MLYLFIKCIIQMVMLYLYCSCFTFAFSKMNLCFCLGRSWFSEQFEKVKQKVSETFQ